MNTKGLKKRNHIPAKRKQAEGPDNDFDNSVGRDGRILTTGNPPPKKSAISKSRRKNPSADGDARLGIFPKSKSAPKSAKTKCNDSLKRSVFDYWENDNDLESEFH